MLELSLVVSTHSRPKAAGVNLFLHYHTTTGFNTQPPEGGWFRAVPKCPISDRFNTQPPEGGWLR